MTELLHTGARLIDVRTGRTFAGEDLVDLVDAAAEQFAADTARRWIAGLPAGIVLAPAPASAAAVARYLGALTAGRPIALLDPDLPGTALLDLIERLAPAMVTGVDGAPPAGYRAADLPGLGTHWCRATAGGVAPQADVAVMVRAGGDSADGTLIELSGQALHDDAEATAHRLGINAQTRGGGLSALFTAQGLAVLNAHLLRGAGVLLPDADRRSTGAGALSRVA
jgi:hypothetical protein